MAAGNLVSDEDNDNDQDIVVQEYNVGDAQYVLFDGIALFRINEFSDNSSADEEEFDFHPRFGDDDDDEDDEPIYVPAPRDSELDDVDPPRDGARAPTNRSADRSSSSIISNLSQASAIRVHLPTSSPTNGTTTGPAPPQSATNGPMDLNSHQSEDSVLEENREDDSDGSIVYVATIPHPLVVLIDLNLEAPPAEDMEVGQH